jgi:hypothetical protein
MFMRKMRRITLRARNNRGQLKIQCVYFSKANQEIRAGSNY